MKKGTRFFVKALSLIISVAALICLVSSCVRNDNTTVRAGVLKGPTGMGAVYMMDNEKYEFSIETSPDAIVSSLTSGALDIAAIPTNLAATVYNKGIAGIKVVAVNTLGVLYVLTNDESIKSISDLSGKKIVTSGAGTTAEAVFSLLLEKASVTADITYVAEHSEAVAQAVSGNYDTVVLPEPFVSNLIAKNAGFSIALNLTEEWEKAGLGALPMGALVATDAFISAHPEALGRFIKDYNESVNSVNSSLAEASVLIDKYGIMAAAVAEKAIPNCNIVCMTGEEMNGYLDGFYSVLYDFNPKLIGGKTPDSGIYYSVGK